MKENKDSNVLVSNNEVKIYQLRAQGRAYSFCEFRGISILLNQ